MGTGVREPCHGVAGFAGGAVQGLSGGGDRAGPGAKSERWNARSPPVRPLRGKPAAASPAGGGASQRAAAGGGPPSPRGCRGSGLVRRVAAQCLRGWFCCFRGALSRCSESFLQRQRLAGEPGQGQGRGGSVWGLLVQNFIHMGVWVCSPTFLGQPTRLRRSYQGRRHRPLEVGARLGGAEARAPARRRRGWCRTAAWGCLRENLELPLVPELGEGSTGARTQLLQRREHNVDGDWKGRKEGEERKGKGEEGEGRKGRR